MAGRDQRERRDRVVAGDPRETFDITGELVRVSDDDVQAGILQRLAYSDKDIVTSGLAGTVVIAGIFTQIAPWWQVALFVVARCLAAFGSHVLSRRATQMGADIAIRNGYLLGLELWFAAIALSWSCVIFLAPSPMLERPKSVLALLAVIAVESVTVLVAAVSRRTIIFVVLAFWSSLSLRALLDHGDSRLPFLVCLALYHAVLTLHALNLQRQTVRNVRSEIVNRMLLDRVTHLHGRVQQQRDELAQVNAQLGEALEQSTELANYDPLTGLLNRRAFLDRVAIETTGMRRHHRSSSLVLLDLDGFKAVNDLYGHTVGDDVLAQCSNVLRAEMRASDVFARWGGEEFIVLLPSTSISEAAACAERYRLALDQHTSPAWPGGLHVSASLGVAELPLEVAFDEAIAAADRALYRAKDEGRNTVRVAPTTARPS